MDFGKAFSFVFEDEEWLKKVGIAGLIMLIPILGMLVVLGWSVEITKRVINNHPEPLPDWDAFIEYLVKGLQVFVIGFVYMLPVTVFQICNLGGMMLMENGADEAVIAAVSILTICFSCFVLLYSLAAGMILPAAIGNFAAKDELKAAFSFGEVFGMVRDNIGAYALVLLGSLAAGFVGSLGAVACVIGIIFTYAYSFAINGHLWGQAYNASNLGGAAAVVAADVEDIPEPDPDFTADF